MFKPRITTGIYIKNAKSGEEVKLLENTLFESSSTIKVPIIYMTLQKAAAEGLPLSQSLKIEKRHQSNGSGIINWTNWEQLALADLISSITRYSDCVATNVLIEFVGGKRTINNFLKSRGLQTRLIMPLLNFPSRERVMPKVGMTTAYEISKLFTELVDYNWPEPYRQFLYSKLAVVDTSWFETLLPNALSIKIWHKTGSMINIGASGDTVFNCAGVIGLNNQKYAFALMSRSKLGANASGQQVLELRRRLVKAFLNELRKIS